MTAYRRCLACLLALAVVFGTAVAARPRLQPAVGWRICVDNLHIQFTSTGYLRDLVKSMATDLVREGEAFTVTASGPSSGDVARTTDRDRLSLFARHVSGAALAPTDVIRGRGSGEVQYREDSAVAAASSTLDAIHDEQGGRQVLILISSGWPSGPEGDPVQKLVSLANSLVVPIVTIDPQQFVRREQPIRKQPIEPVAPEIAALTAASTASLRALSGRTGGLALLDSRDLAAVIRGARSVVRP